MMIYLENVFGFLKDYIASLSIELIDTKHRDLETQYLTLPYAADGCSEYHGFNETRGLLNK